MKLKTSLLVVIIALLLSGCGLFDRAEPGNGNGTQEPPPEETPPPAQSNVQIDRKVGEICIFERTLPNEIILNEPFIVTVVVEGVSDVQSAYVQEVGWFREFRKDIEPVYLWQGIKAGERKAFSYEVTMWSRQAATHPYTSGSVSCNAGGLGLSEELQLRSDLNLIFD